MHLSPLSRFLLILVTTTAASTAQASVTSYGKGCNLPSNAPPLITNLTLPKLNTVFTVRFIGPNSITPVSQDQPALLTGVAATQIPVPPLSSLQPPNCDLLTFPLLIQFMPTSGSAYQDTVSMPIPNDTSLIGVTVYQQFASVYRNCRSTPCVDQMIRVSNGIKVVIGL
ncbi:MAG: hypothetical protein H6837_07970 [Planctomycetes bacterium]|nr:hypothetical protein [Planctomycetota bacterium]